MKNCLFILLCLFAFAGTGLSQSEKNKDVLHFKGSSKTVKEAKATQQTKASNTAPLEEKNSNYSILDNLNVGLSLGGALPFYPQVGIVRIKKHL